MSQVKMERQVSGWEKWKYFQAYFFYPPVLLVLMGNAAGRVGWQKFALTFIAGLIGWTIIEYSMHRWIFHQEERGQWWSFMPWAHHTHHKIPREISLIFAPVWFSLPISLMVWGGLRLLLGDWQTSLLVLSGIWTGYLWYEFVHYTAHCRQPGTRLMRYLKTYHLLHH